MLEASLPGGSAGASSGRLESLLKEADSASRHVNTVHLTFLLFVAYVLVTIASTSHEQLLRIDPVSLPLLDVEVPILGFYVVVPWLVILLHFNLLLQLYLLSRKLFVLQSGLDDPAGTSLDEYRVQLFSFPFTNMLVGHHRRLIHVLLAVMVTVTFIVVPLVALLGAQVAFLPFHSTRITVLQRLAVHLDLLMLWILWPMIVMPSGGLLDWWRAAIGWLRSGATAVVAATRWARKRAPPTRVARPSDAPRLAPGAGIRAPWLAGLGLGSLATIIVSFLTAVVPGEPLERWIANVLPERWIIRGGSCPQGCWAVTHRVFDSWESPFPRNLRLANAVLINGEPPPAALDKLRRRPLGLRHVVGIRDFVLPERRELLEQLRGLDLTNRDLRFADLRGAVLVKADLRGADFTGADLRGADLSAANLIPFDTRLGERCLSRPLPPPLFVEDGMLEAPACRSTLSKANVSTALLPWAHLDHSDLRESDLSRALLVEARFYRAVLDRAVMSGALAYRAYLRDASLRRAQLRDADFRLADLGGVALQGASLENTRLNGADLSDAKLDGCSLRNTRLRAARARATSFRGADLRSSDLTAASFERASFAGADLRGAQIASADFREADLGWADIRGLLRKAFPPSPGYDDVAEQGDVDEAEPLLARLGKPHNLEGAAQAIDALCDEDDLLIGCLDEGQLERYGESASIYLGTLGCEDGDVAAGLIRRLVVRDYANYDRIEWPSLADDALATALLAPTCKSASGLDGTHRWVLARATAGLPSPPWVVPRDIVFPRGIHQNRLGLFPDISSPTRVTHIWLSDTPIAEVTDYYRSRPVRGHFRIETVPGPRPLFRVFHPADSGRTFATITVSPPEARNRNARIEVTLHDLHSPQEAPPGLFD
jgi:uncharacterized protein YjbI with pentapeptide repeats